LDVFIVYCLGSVILLEPAIDKWTTFFKNLWVVSDEGKNKMKDSINKNRRNGPIAQ
jgi:hypothetical protein